MTSLFVSLHTFALATELGSVLRGDVLPEPTPSPTEVLRPGLSQWDVTPGLIGFIAMFCIVLAAVAVWFSMTGKLRKIQHDERRQASAAAARDEADRASEKPADPAAETDATSSDPSEEHDGGSGATS